MKKSEADDKNTFRIKEKLFPFGQASSGLSNFAIYVHIYKSRWLRKGCIFIGWRGQDKSVFLFIMQF